MQETTLRLAMNRVVDAVHQRPDARALLRDPDETAPFVPMLAESAQVGGWTVGSRLRDEVVRAAEMRRDAGRLSEPKHLLDVLHRVPVQHLIVAVDRPMRVTAKRIPAQDEPADGHGPKVNGLGFKITRHNRSFHGIPPQERRTHYNVSAHAKNKPGGGFLPSSRRHVDSS